MSVDYHLGRAAAIFFRFCLFEVALDGIYETM